MMKTVLKGLGAYIALFVLAACGFTPLHDPGFGTKDSASAYKNIRVELADNLKLTDEEGAYYLQQSLNDRLGAQGSVYILKLSPEFTRAGYGISSDDVASRYDMRAKVGYQLLQSVDGKLLDSGSVRSVTTFGAPRDPYGRIASEKNATEQAAREAADRIIIELGRYFSSASSQLVQSSNSQTP